MKVLITGTSARAASANRVGTLGTAMTWALLNDSDTAVTHAPPMESSDADLVFVGVSSPTAPVSNYTYSGFALLADAHASGRLGGVFIDQPSPGAIRSGARTALGDYSRLEANFYAKRPDYGRYAADRGFRSRVLEGIALYLDGCLPLIAPMYPWGNEAALATRIPQGHRITSVDPTGAYWNLAEMITLQVESSSRAPVWVLETAYARPPKIRDRMMYPIITTKSPALRQDFETYSAGIAVLEGDTPIKGWWTPTASAALLSGAAFVGGSATASHFVSPWMDLVEEMDQDSLAALVRRQTDNLRRSTWSMKQLADAVLGVRTSSPLSQTPGTM
jgi:hypothetical protein